MLDDNYKLRGLRNKLVKKLREKGITNEAALTAIAKVPRHVFLRRRFKRPTFKSALQ